MAVLVTGFHNDTDYYTFVNSLYPDVKYEVWGVDVYIPDPPVFLDALVEYFEVKAETVS